MRYLPLTLTAMVVVAAGHVLSAPAAHADGDNNTLGPNNKRLNDGVVANTYTMQHQAGCTNDVKINPQLQLAAQRHTTDVLNNRNLDGDIGSDGSTAQDRANAAGFHGQVAETVAINPALAISGIELINQWYDNPAYRPSCPTAPTAKSGCGRKTVRIAPLWWRSTGSHRRPANSAQRNVAEAALPPGSQANNIPLDPSPDYDASDEVEFGVNWYAWILRGVYPPPPIPPQ